VPHDAQAKTTARTNTRTHPPTLSNLGRFPHGLADLASYFHSLGLKAGVYTDVCHLTCAGYEGSGPSPVDVGGHWALDALTYAQWGFDMIEADFCNCGFSPTHECTRVLFATHAETSAEPPLPLQVTVST
jgi:hypothetical protein